MDSANGLGLARIVRAAKRVSVGERLLADVILNQLKTMEVLCEELRAQFAYHFEKAELDHEFELVDEPPLGPFLLPDTRGIYWAPGSLPQDKYVPNAHYIAAEEILRLAEDLGCDWWEDELARFREEFERTSLLLPLVFPA